MRILLVEDDKHLAELLTAILSNHNYLVDIASDGELAWKMIHVIDYDMVLLDINLPKLDGVALCRRLRNHNQQVPIMLMTVRASVTDKLLGLESGADDYLVKPFDMQELLARIRVLGRRTGDQAAPLVLGAVQLNPDLRQISYKGQVLPLSRKEYLLIELLLRHPYRVFSRSDIVDHLWSLDNLPMDDTVKSHIRRIRRKLKQVGAEDLIETLYGHGYRVNLSVLEPPAASEAALQQERDLAEAIAQVWQTIRTGVLEQVTHLEQAITLLQESVLEVERLKSAQRTAHNLAGTVGSCGFEAAAHIAQAIESLLHQPPAADEAGTLSLLVKALRIQLEQQGEPARPALTPHTSSNPPRTAPIRVLAIDEDPDILDLLRQTLMPYDMQVTALPTLPWNTLEAVQPDLLILDLNLSTVDGLELCQSIRETPRWRRLPILILTSEPSHPIVQQIFNCGADDYITKPIVPNELVTRVLWRIKRSQDISSTIRLITPDFNSNHSHK